MSAEIISIGSELTSGKNLDTNARWLSQRLGEIGVEVGFHTTVADDLQANLDVFRIACSRAKIVLVTGGLGPTADDLTREVLAKLAGAELVFDPTSFGQIEQMFAKRQRVMPERNKVQAYFPAGATPIPNERGTAPGIWMKHGNATIACMPGVPDEMFAMFNDWVLPRLAQAVGGGQAIVHRTLRCFGAGESAIEEKLGDLTRRGRRPEVGITASEGTISLRVTAIGATPAEANQLAEPDVDYICKTLGELVFGQEDDDLQGVVVRLLAERNKTLATAESCTGGLVGHLLTEVPGASRVFLGGVVAYSNPAKEIFVGVPADLLRAKGAVSPEVAAALARGARERFGADLGLGITGIAGPDGGTPEKPVGLVHIALASSVGVEQAQYNWLASRSSVKIRSAKTALNLARLHLLRNP